MYLAKRFRMKPRRQNTLNRYTNIRRGINGYPIGINDFKQIVDNDYHIVDKSKFVSEALTHTEEVNIILRPRCWSKSTSLSMLRYVLSLIDDSYFCSNTLGGIEENRKLFDGLEVMQHENIVNTYMGID